MKNKIKYFDFMGSIYYFDKNKGGYYHTTKWYKNVDYPGGWKQFKQQNPTLHLNEIPEKLVKLKGIPFLCE